MKLFLAKCDKRILKATSNTKRALQFKSQSDAVFFAELVKRVGIKLIGHDLHVVRMSSLDKRDAEVGADAFVIVVAIVGFLGIVVNPKTFNQPDGSAGISEGISLFQDWGRDALQSALLYAMKYHAKSIVADEVAA